MNFKSLLFFGLVLSITACGGNKDESPIPILRFGGMKGNVSKVKESTFDAVEKFGDVYPEELIGVIVQKFDSDGFNISYADYDRHGDCRYKAESTFENGRCVKTKYYERYSDEDREANFVEQKDDHYVWSITEDGRTVNMYYYYEGLREIAKDEDGQIVYELTFDAYGHIIDQKNYADGKIAFRQIDEYDSDGLLTKTTEYYGEGIDPRVRTYMYTEFDKHGNWTTQIVYKDDKPYQVVQAEITYR